MRLISTKKMECQFIMRSNVEQSLQIVRKMLIPISVDDGEIVYSIMRTLKLVNQTPIDRETHLDTFSKLFDT